MRYPFLQVVMYVISLYVQSCLHDDNRCTKGEQFVLEKHVPWGGVHL